ncbi:LytTR family DNA-binding domain-containing protein, partial [Adlercreutzia caecimuris]
FGFFRCHRSYIVNVQKVARVERYTRNTFNLVLSDAAHTSLPLSKGRAEAMRDRYGWK